jgi:ABC-type multidrug transport system fused ATPase/permease subunit
MLLCANFCPLLLTPVKVVCSYRKGTPNVLRGVDFRVGGEKGERIGIVGRTGAGKSSLIAVLLRLLEVNSGSIHIDGIDISALGLHELRSKISVIPQSPFLFSGTLRENLDVFSEYPDELIWSALDCASIGKTLRSNSDGLSAEIAENGSNFSVGERQLLCLARAILQQNKILIMVSASFITYSCDMHTHS